MAVNDTVTCRVEKLVYGGDGLAHIDGRVVFIPGTAVGETIRIRITHLKKSFARAQLEAIIDPAAERITPCCRVTDPATGATCLVPGCVYDHLDYAAERQAKHLQLSAFLSHLCGREAPALPPPTAASDALHYRNKIVLHTDRASRGPCLGYRLEPSHHVIDMASCPLACDAINAALTDLRKTDFFKHLPPEADVTFRHTPHDGVVWWINRFPPPLTCPELLTEISPAGPLRVPRDGFYQVNPMVGDALVRTVAAWFSEDPSVPELLDLYCGVGVFGFACLATGGTRLTGIESGRAAVATAQLNAAALGVSATFLCRALGRDGVQLDTLIGDTRRTTAIIDPPRDGMDISMTRALAESGIARLFYVSCDPATLVRDLKILLADGRYHLTRARLFDMFPRTAHFETLVELRG